MGWLRGMRPIAELRMMIWCPGVSPSERSIPQNSTSRPVAGDTAARRLRSIRSPVLCAICKILYLWLPRSQLWSVVTKTLADAPTISVEMLRLTSNSSSVRPRAARRLKARRP